MSQLGLVNVVHADPNAPQVGTLHQQREDAQRLRLQQRAFDHEEPKAAVITPVPAPADQRPTSGYNRALRNSGLVFLGGAGIAALSSLPFFAADSDTAGSTDDAGKAAGTLLLVTAGLAGITGFVLIAMSSSDSSSSSGTAQKARAARTSSSRVLIVPTASANTVGLAITGRL